MDIASVEHSGSAGDPPKLPAWREAPNRVGARIRARMWLDCLEFLIRLQLLGPNLSAC